MCGKSTRGRYLSDDKQGEVKAVHEQVCDAVLDILFGALHITLNQQLLQTGGDHVLHQQAVVTPHRLNALAVHLVMRVWVGPQQAGIPLLVDQQVREVDLEPKAFGCCMCCCSMDDPGTAPHIRGTRYGISRLCAGSADVWRMLTRNMCAQRHHIQN